jgi:Bardet-Biedl syndrome 7 protein
VLPPGENKTQKVAVGDLSGVVQCFSVKRGEVVLSFKTLPSPLKVQLAVARGCLAAASLQQHAPQHVQGWLVRADDGGGCPAPQVTAMVLGRAARQRDKMFVAAGNTVRLGQLLV